MVLSLSEDFLLSKYDLAEKHNALYSDSELQAGLCF